MKYIEYKNIKLSFTLKTFHFYLKKFWIEEIKIFNLNKIWLTIIVNTNNNNNIIVINNLPFNTLNYKDVLIVLNQFLKENSSKYEGTILKNICIRYKLEKIKEYNKYKKYYYYYLIAVSNLIFFILFNIMLLYILYIYGLEVPEQLLSNINESYLYTTDIKEIKPNIFNPLIDLFNKSGSTHKYFPSYFVPTKFNSLKLVSDSNIKESIIYYQFIINDYNFNTLAQLFKDLNEIFQDYKKVMII